MVVLSLVITTRFATPKSSRVALSSSIPNSDEITVPAVRIAISCNIALRRSPKPGALTAATLTIPRILLTTKVAKASDSTSSAMISNDLPAFATPSRMVIKSRMFEIFLSHRRMYGFSSSTVPVSVLFTKYGDK